MVNDAHKLLQSHCCTPTGSPYSYPPFQGRTCLHNCPDCNCPDCNCWATVSFAWRNTCDVSGPIHSMHYTTAVLQHLLVVSVAGRLGWLYLFLVFMCFCFLGSARPLLLSP